MSAGEVYYAEDGTVSMVLDDKIDPNYEPSKEELDEYAKWLGIDVDAEAELMWIAREGLKAPLPTHWKPCKTDTGDVYYFNFNTGDSIWEHPLDEHFKKKVVDERAKLRTKPSGGTKKKTESSVKLEKGAAGNVSSAATSAPAKTTSKLPTSKLPTSIPLKGRLGAIGSNGPAKPDISEILPAPQKAVPAAFALHSPATDTAAEDVKLRDSLKREFDAQLEKLRASYAEQLAERKAEQARELQKLERTLNAQLEEEVEDAKRAADRRTKRELQMFEESIERQLDDLRRTLRQEQLRRDAEVAAADSRTVQELSNKRRASELAIEAQVAAKRSEMLAKWNSEKQAAEQAAAATAAEMQRAHLAQVAAAEEKEQVKVAQSIAQLTASLDAEMLRLQNELQIEHDAVIRELQAKGPASAGSNAPEYTAAEAHYAEAIAKASARAADAASELKAQFAQRRDEAMRQHKEKMAAIEAGIQRDNDTLREKIRAQLTAEAQQRIQDTLQALENDLKQNEVEFRQHATDVLEAKRAAALTSANEQRSAAQQEAHSLMSKHAALEREELERVRASYEAELAQYRSLYLPDRNGVTAAVPHLDIEEAKRAWVLEHPPPPPVSDGQDVTSAAHEAQQRALADEASSLQDLRTRLENELKQTLEAHRAKAMGEMDRRLETYQSEQRRRIAHSPSKAAEATELTAASELILAQERARLQAHLDEVALSLASSVPPPRPCSAPSRELPQLRSSGSIPSPTHEDANHRDTRKERMLRRIERARERIKREKVRIRQRIDDLEASRAEWRRDMAKAKEERDHRRQQILHVAKGALEERARVLNEDTAALKASIDLLKREERLLAEPPHTPADLEGAKMYEALRAIAAKVETVENRIRSTTTPPARCRKSPLRHVAEKWAKLLQPKQRRHVDVEGWLDNTSSL